MILEEKKISSEYIYRGRVVCLRKDEVILPNNNISTREILEHNGGVCIIALEGNDVYLVEQFRYAIGKIITELPAGKLEKNEDHYKCAQRELREECGCGSDNLVYLGFIYPSVGYVNELIHIYLATNLTYCEQKLDEDEFLTVIKMPFKEAFEKALNGEFNDAKTVAGLLRAKHYLDKK